MEDGPVMSVCRSIWKNTFFQYFVPCCRGKIMRASVEKALLTKLCLHHRGETRLARVPGGMGMGTGGTEGHAENI